MHQRTTDTDRHDEERRQEQIRRNQAALEMLRTWDQEDPDEQRETWEFLKHALDEHSRSSADMPSGAVKTV
jgi:hypothetical protein